ncbi:hypothetical protein GIB67_019193 [Kingdonia uniflora]|uniref:Cucumisin n=1 Tax=Kingdonia uniflora TaxID=39325 RepID=A0A7J7N045_9MAGN|nr:hypothetical protein GIB67_019193 [Kingdonia uniflora]
MRSNLTDDEKESEAEQMTGGDQGIEDELHMNGEDQTTGGDQAEVIEVARDYNILTPSTKFLHPSVDILAAWSPVSPPSNYYDDKRSVNYNIISRTSMSCPHVTGAAAFVKAAHPNWSPAPIKSALMTTAYVMDPRKHADLEFAYGSGHINPLKAVNPGLVFDASEADYVELLCHTGYNTSKLQLVTGDSSSCNNVTANRGWDLNYPSFSLAIKDGEQVMGTFTRRITNVRNTSTYYATVSMPGLVTVKVEPSVLSFTETGEKKSFTVKVYGPKITQQPIISGSILWKDGSHVIRSPLVVYTMLPFSTDQTNKQPAFLRFRPVPQKKHTSKELNP